MLHISLECLDLNPYTHLDLKLLLDLKGRVLSVLNGRLTIVFWLWHLQNDVTSLKIETNSRTLNLKPDQNVEYHVAKSKIIG